MNPKPTVAKFGGSTFAELSDYARIAVYLLQGVRDRGVPSVAVVSAMPGETESLRERLAEVNASPSYRGTAGLLTLADIVSAQLLQEAVIAAGGTALALPPNGHGIVTDRDWTSARILSLSADPVLDAAREHDVVVVPGGPAADGTGTPTWMGKNSSDLAAVALTAALGGTECAIHSDVHSVYDADPALVPTAAPLPSLSYGTASALSLNGAKVLHHRSVRLAWERGITIHCRGNRDPYEYGTTIGQRGAPVQAVLIDLRAELLGFTDDQTLDKARAALSSRNVDTIEVPGDEGPLISVPGGYSDSERLLDDAGIDHVRRPGRVVTEIDGAQTHHHVVPDEESALRLGKRLHHALSSDRR
ncbi:amino acid kinase family protein [Nocardiopsis valliformis]|uniref:amino acid kinase family protein n=1 Tax=Nocardiopsis valliformis TaxID=239974 RepID=UPI00034917C3|nr:hypothetical protein [Nocardiopsis valliformis]